jgi:hypothetical protein
LGAPYLDINLNGKWDQGIDKPKYFGDQQIWSVINDVNNLKHQMLSGTKPIGIEIQSLYSVQNDSGELGDVMSMRWKIINRSDADYDSVYIGLWSDPDLGNANDDLPGCDTLLDLGYFYNGDDNDEGRIGYGNMPPAGGWGIISGPIVEGELSDSVNIDGEWLKGVKSLSPSSFIVVAAGTFPQLVDPGPDGTPEYSLSAYDYLKGMAGTAHRYILDPITQKPMKFFFAGDPLLPPSILNALPENFPLGRFFPQDVRMSLNIGPFTLAKGDTQLINAVFVMAQDNHHLSSVLKMKHIVNMLKNRIYAYYPIYPRPYVDVLNRGDSSEIRIQCNINPYSIQSVVGYLKKWDGTLHQTLQLYDDGKHFDGLPGDYIWGNSFVTANLNQAMNLDVSFIDSLRVVGYWKAIVSGIITARLSILEPRIYSDNFNHDFKANPTENVRYGFGIKNLNCFPLCNLSVIPIIESDYKTKTIPLINENYIYRESYDPSKPETYFSFNVPADFTLPQFSIPLLIFDNYGNKWMDTIQFPVEPLVKQFAVLNRISEEKIDGNFDILISDPLKIKNHLYVIRGLEPIDSLGNVGFVLKDSTDNRILISQSSLPTSGFDHNNIVTDGFIVQKGSMEYDLKGKNVSFTPVATPWFTTPAGIVADLPEAGIFLGSKCPLTAIRSTLSRGAYHKIQIRFAVKSGYDDANGSGNYELSEKYYYDTTDISKSQKAFYYASKYSFLPAIYEGFRPVPFTVHDVDVNPPKQLTVAILDENRNVQWDLVPYTGGSLRNLIFITSVPYDPTGTSYDSTNAGTIVLMNPQTSAAMPLMWVLFMASRSGYEPYSSEITLTIDVTHPFSSLSVLTFNPTNVVGIDKEIVPSEFKLFQNYPNPFNPTTAISYQLSAISHIKLTVFDILGREIETLVNEVKPAGKYSVEWNASSIASGVYFYQLRAGEFVKTKKMILLR